MLYYRYRPISELTLKELRYNELYFSSRAENNDPYDGKVFLSYDFNIEKWERFVYAAIAKSGFDEKFLKELSKKLAKKLHSDKILTYQDIVNCNFMQSILLVEPSLGEIFAYNLTEIIKQFIDVYRPHDKYSVSFSKTNDEILLWSHYASKHKGFCLVFKAIEGCLYQDKKQKRTLISRKTPKGIISPRTSSGIADKFQFNDITYCSECTKIDASKYMPNYVYGKCSKEEESCIVQETYLKSFEKHDCWQYEKESRLILDTPLPWISGEHFEYSQDERLFYYQPTQLVGIIYGALMDDDTKNRLNEIVRNVRNRMWENIKDDIVFDFIVFQANISNQSRTLDIIPEEIHTATEVIKNTEDKFNTLYDNWLKGEGIKFNEKGGAKKVIII